jgi:hypothetical protein
MSESSPAAESKSGKTLPRREGVRPNKVIKKEAPDSQHHVAMGTGASGGGLSPKPQDQLGYCGSLVREMLSKKHTAYAWPFYKPVDVNALRLHDYHEIIKHPMDLSSIKVCVIVLCFAVCGKTATSLCHVAVECNEREECGRRLLLTTCSPGQAGEQAIPGSPGVCCGRAVNVFKLLQVQPPRPRSCGHGTQATGTGTLRQSLNMSTPKLSHAYPNMSLTP